MAKKFSELRAGMSPESQARAKARIREMLEEMPLQELRQARGLSQKMLAEVLHVRQPAIAKLEKRTDMYISTLRSHIEAMGGHLEVVARFPDGEVRISNFSDLKPGKRETELLKRDAKRDLNAELLESMQDMKAGRVARVSVVTRDGRVFESPVARVRVMSQLSQARFAELLGVSPRTLQEWEQGRRQPSGATKTLLRVAERHPEVLRELSETAA